MMIRLCNLLEQWTSCHPYDFTATGALQVFSGIVRLISNCPSAMSYSLAFQRFETQIPQLEKSRHTWNLQSDVTANDLDHASEEKEEARQDKSTQAGPGNLPMQRKLGALLNLWFHS
jgi:hypothetical protein